jgi:hypothetical protein
LAAFELASRSAISPAAASTLGRARTSSSRSADTVARPLEEKSTICLPLMTASVPSYDSVKIPSKAFRIVSVRTKEPLTIATPITTARAVRKARSLRPARPLSVTPIIVRSPLPSP